MIEWKSQSGDSLSVTNQENAEAIEVNDLSNPQSVQYWLDAYAGNLDDLSASNILVINSADTQSVFIDQSNEGFQDIHLSSNGFSLDHNPINMSTNDRNVDEQFSNMTPPNYDYEETCPVSMWNSPTGFNEFKIEDVFQVDKEDLFQGPTLAELNANDESLFDTLNAFDFCPSEVSAFPLTFQNETNSENVSNDGNICSEEKQPMKEKPIGDKTCSSQKSFNSNTQWVVHHNESEKTLDKPTTVNEERKLVKANVAQNSINIPSCSKFSHQRNPETTDSTTEEHYSNICENSIPTDFWKTTKLPSEKYEFHDENTDDETLSSSVDSDEDEDDDDEDDDDEVDVVSMPKKIIQRNKGSGGRKRPCYFWQYNMQAKGPKCVKSKQSGTTLMKPSTSTMKVIKSRRSDSNDLTPCPQKLHNIGIELDKLNSVINNMIPVNSLPVNARPKCRKEKNKLASRVCRLKKKAQYEANKLKLYGLKQEHASLLNIVNKVKRIMVQRVSNSTEKEFCCEKAIGAVCSSEILSVVDSQAEFVNAILKNVESGDPSGGLQKWFDKQSEAKGR